MPPNRLDHFYLGGARITDLRGVPATSERSPEEWLASTTTRFGEDRVGLSTLPDGSLLRDAVAADPRAWLGDEHTAGFGTSTGLLVKLLDAGQRLPVHLHPDRAFAARHLDCDFGKTEAWYVLEADPGAVCHLGFRREMARSELDEHVSRQDTDALLDAMHPVEVRAGDGILVPAGLPHAIGSGIFVVEAQEPTDLSILLEWAGLPIDGEADGHVGVGFATALEAVDRRAWASEDLDGLVRSTAPDGAGSDELAPLLPSAAGDFFRVHLARPRDAVSVEAGFAVLILLQGPATLVAENGEVPVSRGEVVVVPHAAGRWELRGGAAVVCRPAVRGPRSAA